MPRVTAEYLTALKTSPVVNWEKPVETVASNVAADPRVNALASQFENVKVWNSAISPSQFSIEVDDRGTQGMRAYLTTPQMRLESIGCADEGTNNEVRDYISSLYMDNITMKDYADVIAWDQVKRTNAGAGRYNMFASRWKEGQIFSGFICYGVDDLPVGIVNIGSSGTHGVAEFAAIFSADDQRQSYGSEAAMLLFSYPDMARKMSHKIPDGSVPHSITATAKIHHGSDKILERIGMPVTETSEKYGATRNHRTSKIDDMVEVLENTRLRNRLGFSS